MLTPIRTFREGEPGEVDGAAGGGRLGISAQDVVSCRLLACVLAIYFAVAAVMASAYFSFASAHRDGVDGGSLGP